MNEINLASFPEVFLSARAGAPYSSLWFAKTLADFEINDIAALPPLFCYDS